MSEVNHVEAIVKNPEKEPLKVYLINPGIEDPWRTRADYIKEQKQETIKFWITIITLFISIITMLTTSYYSVKSIQLAEQSLKQSQTSNQIL